MHLKNIFFVGFLALLVGCGSSGDQQSKQKEIKKKSGKPQTAADYVQRASFTTFSGDTVSVSKFKGKVVVIDFWETWCGPCIKSFPALQKLVKKYPDNFAVLAVTPGFMDTKKDARNFAKDHDYDFHYLLDYKKLNQRLGVRGIPYKVFLDPNGKYIKKQMGSHGPKGDYHAIKKIIEKYKNS